MKEEIKNQKAKIKNKKCDKAQVIFLFSVFCLLISSFDVLRRRRSVLPFLILTEMSREVRGLVAVVVADIGLLAV